MVVTLHLATGDDHVTIEPAAGGRITSAVLGGAERLITTPPGAAAPEIAPFQWGMFVMAPWAGRIADGVLEWEGATHHLATVAGHALHGTTVHAEWELVDADEGTAELAVDLDGGGWPFGGRAEHRIELTPGRLRCRLTVVATTSMPAWIGWHPCFARPASGDLHVGLDADEALEADGPVPTGRRLPVAGDADLRAAPPTGARRLDTALLGNGGPARMDWPDLRLRIFLDVAAPTWVVFTPAHEVGVEPQTGWPDALRLAQAGVDGTGVTALGPGESLTATMTWSWQR